MQRHAAAAGRPPCAGAIAAHAAPARDRPARRRPQLSPAATAAAPPGRGRRAATIMCNVLRQVTLPNGLEISYTSTPDEALFFYQEHFVDHVYLRDGVALQPGDTVVDVGGNIGLFALAAAEACGPTGRVISFEPIPEVAAAARDNVARHAAWCAVRGRPVAPVTVVNAAVGAAAGEAEFTVYARAAGWATMAPDDCETVANMQAYIESRLAAIREQGSSGGKQASSGGGSERSSDSMGQEPVGLVERLLLPTAAALTARPWARGVLRSLAGVYIRAVLMGGTRGVRCNVVTLSQVLQQHGIEQVSLLKIDVERAELEVLQGLDGADWSRVQQVAMEVHDTGSWQAGASGGSEQAAGSSGGLTSGDGDLTSASSSNAVGPSISGGSGSASSGSSSRLLSGSGRGGGGANGAGAAPAGTGGRLAAVRALLAAAGLTRICVEQDVLLTGTTLHNVYAMRQHRGG